MSSIFQVSVSGILAQQRKVDVAANNIANLTTNGFKRSRTLMEDTKYEQLLTDQEIADQRAAGLPTPKEVGSGVELGAIQRLFIPGALYQTSQPLDVAINGSGFFALQMPDGTRAYTRDGSFTLDANGQLVTKNGYLVTPPVVVPANAMEVQIDQSGNISARLPGSQNLVPVGKLQIVTFPNEGGLSATGNNLFVETPNSGPPTAGDPGTGTRGRIASGFLEGSNVDMAEETTRMIEAQRAYQLNIKALQTLDEMLSTANNMRR